MIHSAYCGDISEDGAIRLLGYVPPEASNGYNVRAVRLCVSSELPGGQDYWVVRIGTLDGSTFTARTEIDLGDGLKVGERRWSFARELRIPRGTVIALKAVKRGDPDTILGLSLILEYGILGARSN